MPSTTSDASEVRLPMRPAIFILLYLALAVASGALQDASFGRNILAVLASGFAAILQIAWTVQAQRFANSVGVRTGRLSTEAGRARNNRTAAQFGVAAVILMLVLLYALFIRHATSTPTTREILIEVAATVCGFTGLGLVLVGMWRVATDVCRFEGAEEVSPNRIVGTFLLFIYLVIGAPFIFVRLKRMKVVQANSAI